MTPAQQQTLAEAIAHHNEMVRLYEQFIQMREHGENPLRSPAMHEAKKLALKVEALRRALAAFSISEMNRERMAPYFVSQELLSTMRTMIRTAHGQTLRHAPEEIGPDGIPGPFRPYVNAEGSAPGRSDVKP